MTLQTSQSDDPFAFADVTVLLILRFHCIKSNATNDSVFVIPVQNYSSSLNNVASLWCNYSEWPCFWKWLSCIQNVKNFRNSSKFKYLKKCSTLFCKLQNSAFQSHMRGSVKLTKNPWSFLYIFKRALSTPYSTSHTCTYKFCFPIQ